MCGVEIGEGALVGAEQWWFAMCPRAQSSPAILHRLRGPAIESKREGVTVKIKFVDLAGQNLEISERVAAEMDAVHSATS